MSRKFKALPQIPPYTPENTQPCPCGNPNWHNPDDLEEIKRLTKANEAISSMLSGLLRKLKENEENRKVIIQLLIHVFNFIGSLIFVSFFFLKPLFQAWQNARAERLALEASFRAKGMLPHIFPPVAQQPENHVLFTVLFSFDFSDIPRVPRNNKKSGKSRIAFSHSSSHCPRKTID